MGVHDAQRGGSVAWSVVFGKGLVERRGDEVEEAESAVEVVLLEE